MSRCCTTPPRTKGLSQRPRELRKPDRRPPPPPLQGADGAATRHGARCPPAGTPQHTPPTTSSHCEGAPTTDRATHRTDPAPLTSAAPPRPPQRPTPAYSILRGPPLPTPPRAPPAAPNGSGHGTPDPAQPCPGRSSLPRSGARRLAPEKCPEVLCRRQGRKGSPAAAVRR